eukprot:gene20389-31376_t
MLSDPGTAKMIARVARELDAGESRRGGGIKLVVGPVMVTASGSALAVTPNLLEAAVLLGPLRLNKYLPATTGSFGMTAISALTAQNTRGVTGIHSVPTDFVEEQLRACVDDIGVRVFKTGMLSDPSTAKMIARVARELDAGDSRRGGGIKLVVDPVMVAASGSALASTAVVQAMLTDLLPAAFLITPNLLEAAVLLGREGEHICPLDSLEESLVAAARQLCEKT